MKLTSNTILITGGASGIGYELTKQLTALGNTILITGRDQAKMDRAKAAFPKIHTFRSDVSDPEAIATLYEKVTKQFPELDILINNAGIMREINVHDKAGSLEDITREIEINLSGPIRMVKQFLPHLKTKSKAAIMNVSSGLAFVPLPISPVYCATKAGLHSFTESLGAWIYFETNEPIGRSYAENTGLIRRVAIKRASQSGDCPIRYVRIKDSGWPKQAEELDRFA